MLGDRPAGVLLEKVGRVLDPDVGLVGFRWFDFPTFLIASVIVDVRVVLVVMGVLGGPTHGPLHTFAGAGVLGLLFAGVTFPLRPRLDPLLERVGLPQARSPFRIVVAALVGVWLHVVLDAFLYADLRPFAPFGDANPLLGLVPTWAVYGACVAAAVIGTGTYAALRSGAVSVPSGPR